MRWLVGAACCFACLPIAVFSSVSMGDGADALGAESSDEIRDMLRWLERGGAVWGRGLRIREVLPGQRGLVTLNDRFAGEALELEVPLKMAISIGNCQKNGSFISSRLSSHLRQRLQWAAWGTHGLLHICLAEHAALGDHSEFGPYLRSLPQSLDHLPLLTTLNVSTLLHGSPLLRDVTNHRRNLLSLYDEICWEFPDFGQRVVFHQFMFLFGMVESHSHGRPGDGEAMMVPLIDLVNHRADPDLHIRSGGGGPGDERAVLRLGHRAVEADQEIFFSYAAPGESSGRFFRQFGFVDECLNVTVKLVMQFRPEDPGFEAKRLLCPIRGSRKKLSRKAASTTTQPPQTVDRLVSWSCSPASQGFRPLKPSVVLDVMLPFARFVTSTANPEELQESCDVAKWPPACRAPLDGDSEDAAVAYLRGAAGAQLGRYPPTDDEVELRELVARSAPEAPYVRIRRDERRCLETLRDALMDLSSGPTSSPPSSVKVVEL